jgi:hypothetical protein
MWYAWSRVEILDFRQLSYRKPKDVSVSEMAIPRLVLVVVVELKGSGCKTGDGSISPGYS